MLWIYVRQMKPACRFGAESRFSANALKALTIAGKPVRFVTCKNFTPTNCGDVDFKRKKRRFLWDILQSAPFVI